jgi:hypothetical protein
VTADNFPQWVFSGAKVADLRHTQSGPEPARHPVLDVGYPRSPFRARTSSNSFAHRLGTGNSALQLAPGPVGLKPELRQGRSELIYKMLIWRHNFKNEMQKDEYWVLIFCCIVLKNGFSSLHSYPQIGSLPWKMWIQDLHNISLVIIQIQELQLVNSQIISLLSI